MDVSPNDPNLLTIAIKPVRSPFWGFYCGFRREYNTLLDGVLTPEEYSDIISALNELRVTKSEKAKVISLIMLSRGAYNPTKKDFYKKVEDLFEVVQELNNQYNARDIHFKIIQTHNKECLVELRFRPVRTDAEVNNKYTPKEKEYEPYPLHDGKFSKLVNY
ncbi:hypothetical protein SAMD00019534_100420 [Acytostelium subglobosum LB1]|uniref:hypothetical protein n=1 Tax=Acytostelium subglobosum LB1 TaxID=1410327 RepID=UPI0006449DCB|nr:hypothetical protein SAMD00019534_100420 [Acytostelium subglobosum LB1]GAM26867.1 hypothetical protein SAMD00019534_100420 [Acytostelium subglobosum LB1]|eukprot:XP_012750135.1 hypothetical protein SAMD00019534_100420 [Acytostelium subglobosum LB1]